MNDQISMFHYKRDIQFEVEYRYSRNLYSTTGMLLYYRQFYSIDNFQYRRRR